MRRAVVPLLSIAIAAIVLGALPVAAVAQGKLPATDGAADLYRQHMDVGISFYEQRNYAAAIAEFAEAYNARPKASPLVNMALCYKALFAYTKAIRALETALSRHADTMDDNDKKAAQTEIDEMRARLSYVTFKVTPSAFAVEVDGESFPDAAKGTPVALSPGPHNVKVSADGYAGVDQQITVASGQHAIEYTLKANMGFVRIKTPGPRYAILVDQKPYGSGEWAGLVPPGPHIVEWYLPGAAASSYRVRVDVEIGTTYDLSPGKGGVALPDTGVTGPPIPLPPKPPAKPVTGFFALAAVSLFWPTEQPAAFSGEEMSPGVSAGLRVGYRVNTPVSFDAMFSYSNILVRRHVDEAISYNLELLRGGLNMRLQTPGKVARFYGNFGGGAVFDSLDFNYGSVKDGYALCTKQGTASCKDASGADGYFLIEGGLQFSFGSVLVDLAVGTILQSTRGFGLKTYNDWLPQVEAGLRVGYAAW